MYPPQWLQSFQALAEQGSFTRAAAVLGLTQAAVSQHIRQLEQQTGPLVLRGSRPLELTPAGEALSAYCLELERADRQLALRLSGQQATRGPVTLTSPGSIGLRLYPLLLDYQCQFPELAIHYRFSPDDEIIHAVTENRYEMGLTTLKPDDRRLRAEKFTDEPLELVAPAGAAINSWQDLQRLGFIDHPDGKGMATRLLSRRYPGNPGISSLPVHGFSNQVSLVLEPVARGLGFTILPRFARLAFSRQQEIQALAGEPALIDTLWLIYRAEWPLTARARQMLDWLRPQL
ncbi:LysR family transcriptional regulator [Salmonella enterica subsp. enterica serovar Choleraesuis]|nr:LysR family transcriptional regulator [Salmonella enterica subsp. enterica serovar Choleraesuis]